MKRFLYTPLSLCLFFGIFVPGSQIENQTEQLVLNTLQVIGLQPEQYVLHHGGRVDTTIPKEQVEGWINSIKKSLAIKKIEKLVDNDGIKYRGKKVIDQKLILSFTVINDQPKQSLVQPYLALQIYGQGRPDHKLLHARTHLFNILYNNHIRPQFHFSVQGSVSQPPSRLEGPIAKVLHKLRAVEVESMRTKQTISISAYSPLLENGLQTRGGLMNVQIATHFNHNIKRLIFTIGTPIITIEY